MRDFRSSRVFIAGHAGMVGSAVVRNLEANFYQNLIVLSRSDLNLENTSEVMSFFKRMKPDVVIMCAGRVGGILENSKHPVSFFLDNMKMAMNVMECSHRFRVQKLIYLSSSCVYPIISSIPIQESALLTGEFEKTNEGYALAKSAAMKLCDFYAEEFKDSFHSVVPCNLFGPNDNYDLERSHVIPALVRKFTEATIQQEACVSLWGTGKVRREFLHVDDLANAVRICLEAQTLPRRVNVGASIDYSIQEVAKIIRDLTGFQGEIFWDTSMPDGVKQKLLDSSLIHELGWAPKINLHEGIEKLLRDEREMSRWRSAS